jgi:hypothetical protein
MSTASYEALAKEVQEKHGVALGNDDPILVMHTINQRLAADMQASIDAAMEKLRQDLEALYLRWDGEAKARADRLLSASVNAAKTHLTARADSLVAESRRSIEEAASPVLARVERSAARIETLAVAVTVAALVCAGSVIWALTFGVR